jgi:four helix bundle protein
MQQTPVRSFTELVAWQQARVVRKAIRVLVKDWPPEEKFRLVDQIIRTSRGPCANIAEGFGRFHEKDNARFCRMAKSSLYETMDHLTAA